MGLLANIPRIFTAEFRHWDRVELFRNLLYIFLLLNTLSLLPIARELWDYNGMVRARMWYTDVPLWSQGSYGLTNLLSHPANSYATWVYKMFVAGQLVFLITGLLRIVPVISSFMVFFFTINLFKKGYLMFTGGEVLVTMLLFYLIFIHCTSEPSEKQSLFSILRRRKVLEPKFSFYQNVLNQVFFRLLLFQICLLYFFSAYYKFIDPIWTSGDAIMYISRIGAYSSGITNWLFAESPGLSAIATWTTLIYQALFPFVVWIKQIKLPFLAFGVLFHLGIAFGMGIFSFGIIMIVTYVLFLDERHVKLLKFK